MKKGKKRILVRCIIIFFCLIALGVLLIFGLSEYVTRSTEKQIVEYVNEPEGEISEKTVNWLKQQQPDCIMVLGAQVWSNGSPSYMLRDRLDVGIELYKKGVAPKLLLTGDHGQRVYDEVNVMKRYTLSSGVPKEDMFLDHAGFSTYDSIYRAKAVFQVKKMVVVTQGYHQHRALYGSNRMGITAWGVASDQRRYVGQGKRDLREIAARDKDFFKWIFKPEPVYLGETIPINGNGIKSQD